MRDYQKELRELQERIVCLHRDSARLETLCCQEQAAQQECKVLLQCWNREQADVDRLERLTLSAIFANITGKKEEKLEREEAEAYAARLKYQVAEQQLREIQREIAECRERIQRNGDCQVAYQALLREKQGALKEQNPTLGRQIADLEEKINGAIGQQKELEEALAAGEKALRQLDKVAIALDSAGNWGTWDVLGGGLLTDVMKYSQLDEAQGELEQLQFCLRRYQTELADVTALHIADFHPDGLTGVVDILFDNIFTDWAVLARIQNSQAQIQALGQQLTGFQRQLAQDLERTRRDLTALQEELEILVRDA